MNNGKLEFEITVKVDCLDEDNGKSLDALIQEQLDKIKRYVTQPLMKDELERAQVKLQKYLLLKEAGVESYPVQVEEVDGVWQIVRGFDRRKQYRIRMEG